MAASLVIADDHPLILNGLEQLFRDEPDLKVVARCTSGDETLSAVRRHRPDILLLDVNMPGTDGLQVLRQLRADKVGTRVVLLTASLDDQDLLEAIRLGIRGLVLKELAPKLLVQAVRKVSEGGQWLEKDLVTRAVDRMLRQEAAVRDIGAALTPRELEVVRMVATGMTNKQVGAHLSISEGTVKIHLHKVYEKLQVDGRLALTILARDRGLV